MSIRKSEVNLNVNGKTAAAYLAQPENGGPGVLVLHAWWGLNPFFKQVCSRLAENGFTALAPDLFKGRVASSREEAKELVDGQDEEFIGSAIKAAEEHLASITGGKLGVMGFSFGAAWALVTAAEQPDIAAIPAPAAVPGGVQPEIAAVVLFYGTYVIDFSRVKAKVLGHFAESDEWEPLEGVREMEAALKSAGLETTFHIHPGTAHWFMEDDRPEYNESAADLAWERTIEFLKANLP